MFKYLDIDSTYRNRNQYPNPGQFNIINSQKGQHLNLLTSVDPISLATPIITFIPNDLWINDISIILNNNTNTEDSIIIGIPIILNPSKITNYYRGSLLQFNEGDIFFFWRR